MNNTMNHGAFASASIGTTCTPFDVINGNGRGRKVQAHPGNVKYRTLVLVNKVSRIKQDVKQDRRHHIDLRKRAVQQAASGLCACNRDELMGSLFVYC